MKKIVAFILVLAAITSILTACNPSDASDVSSSVDNGTSNNNSSTLSESSTEFSVETSTQSSRNEVSVEVSEESKLSSEEIAAQVNGALDIILADVNEYSFNNGTNESDLAKNFPEEFSSLIALGEKAFPALDKILKNTDNTETRRAFVAYTKNFIKPVYDPNFISPDGKYTVKGSVITYLYKINSSGEVNQSSLEYRDVRLVEKATESVVVKIDGIVRNISVSWNKDSRYAAISYQQYSGIINVTGVFDVSGGKLIMMPLKEDVGKAVGNELSNKDYTRVLFTFDKWVSDNKIKVKIETRRKSDNSTDDNGFFTYDLVNQKIVDGKFTVAPDKITPIINKYLDIILAKVGKNTFGVNKKEEDLAKEFPKEFGELVALGENSIYYFNQIYINKDNSPTRRAMAWYVIQNIKKLDPYNRFRSTSPDYNYWIECFPNSVIDSLNNFTGITYKISLLDRKTESVILKLDNNDSNKNVEWSREDKYAALSHGYYSEIAGIIDVKNAKFITLPDKSKLESSLGVKLSYTDAKGNIYSDVLYRFMEWTNDNNLKVNINLYNEKYGGYNAGYFIFDISKNKIVDSSFKVVLEQVLYPKDIVSKIRWYLDTMTQNNTDYLNEMELAEKYPEEFEALIALGEKAFPIYDEMISKFENFEQRGLAMYVKYTLKPELYKDYSFDSPYGNYSLKSSIISFTGGYNFGILYGNFNLVDKKTGEVLIASNISLPDGQTEVNWSKDGKYVSISSGWIRYATDVYIFDIEDKKLIEMPSLDEIDDTLKHGISYSYYGVHFRFKEWLPDNKVRIEIFTVISATQGGIGEGWYIYDLKANKIVDGHYEITEEPMFNN